MFRIASASLGTILVPLVLALGGCALDASPDEELDDEATAETGRSEDALTAGCETCGFAPNSFMRNVTIGMTKRQVRRVLGAPGSVEHTDDSFGNVTVFRYGKTMIRMRDQDDGGSRVEWIQTTSPKVRTDAASGSIGVGSTERELLRNFPGMECRVTGEVVCMDKALDPNHRAVKTWFIMQEGRIIMANLQAARHL